MFDGDFGMKYAQEINVGQIGSTTRKVNEINTLKLDKNVEGFGNKRRGISHRQQTVDTPSIR